MMFWTIVLIFALVTTGFAMCLACVLFFSMSIEALAESETGRCILDKITRRKMKGAKMISPKEFAEKMGQIAEEKDDTEVCHIKMDDYICEVLRTLGYEEGVEIFENTPKWYS